MGQYTASGPNFNDIMAMYGASGAQTGSGLGTTLGTVGAGITPFLPWLGIGLQGAGLASNIVQGMNNNDAQQQGLDLQRQALADQQANTKLTNDRAVKAQGVNDVYTGSNYASQKGEEALARFLPFSRMIGL